MWQRGEGGDRKAASPGSSDSPPDVGVLECRLGELTAYTYKLRPIFSPTWGRARAPLATSLSPDANGWWMGKKSPNQLRDVKEHRELPERGTDFSAFSASQMTLVEMSVVKWRLQRTMLQIIRSQPVNGERGGDRPIASPLWIRPCHYWHKIINGKTSLLTADRTECTKMHFPAHMTKTSGLDSFCITSDGRNYRQ